MDLISGSSEKSKENIVCIVGKGAKDGFFYKPLVLFNMFGVKI